MIVTPTTKQSVLSSRIMSNSLIALDHHVEQYLAHKKQRDKLMFYIR